MLVLLLLLLVLVPVLFRDRIAQRVKTEVNRTLNARVDWRDAGLGFFRDFPNLTLRLDDLTVVGVGKFQGDTLAAIRHLRVVLDLASVLRSVIGRPAPIVVRAVELDQPRLSLIALEDGTANWDITKKDAAAAAPAETAGRADGDQPAALRDRRAAPSRFDNRQAKLKASLVGFDQSLTGDFSQDRVAIQTRAHADTVSVEFAGIPYLNRVRLDLTADVAGGPGQEVLHPQGHRAPAQRPDRSASPARRRRPESTRPRPGLQRAQHRVPAHPVAGAGRLRPRLPEVKTSGTIAVVGRVKGEYGDSAFPSFALERQGRQRRLPVSRSAAPGAGHLPGPRDHQPRRQRRQHRREPEPLPPRARAESGGRGAGAADADVRPRRRCAREGQGGSGRRPPHHEARGDRPADRHRRGRRGGADADVVRRQEAVRPGRGERHRGRRATSPSRARPCRIRSRSSRRRSGWRRSARSSSRSPARSAAATSRRRARSTTCSASSSGTTPCAGTRPCGATGST